MTTRAPLLDVVAVGHAIVDVLVQCDDSLLERLGLDKGSRSVVDGPRAEEISTAIGPGVVVSGGPAANTAAGIAALGGEAAFLGKVRDDELGEAFTYDLRATGVRYLTAPARSGPGTAHCLVLMTPDGQRTTCTHLGIAGELSVDDVGPQLVQASAITVVDATLIGVATAEAAVAAAVSTARRTTRRVALRLSDPTWVVARRPAISAFLPSVDIVLGNEDTACRLTSEPDAESSLSALSRWCPSAAVTRGDRGAVVTDGTDLVAVPAEPVVRVVDTTGAGDLFAAGFLLGLARELDVAGAARLGALAAAEIVSHAGTRPEVSLADQIRQAGIWLPPAPSGMEKQPTS